MKISAHFLHVHAVLHFHLMSSWKLTQSIHSSRKLRIILERLCTNHWWWGLDTPGNAPLWQVVFRKKRRKTPAPVCCWGQFQLVQYMGFVCLFVFEQLYCPSGISPMGSSGCLPCESQLQQRHTTQPTVHAGCFSVSIIHQTLTWTMGSLTCAQM